MTIIKMHFKMLSCSKFAAKNIKTITSATFGTTKIYIVNTNKSVFAPFIDIIYQFINKTNFL